MRNVCRTTAHLLLSSCIIVFLVGCDRKTGTPRPITAPTATNAPAAKTAPTAATSPTTTVAPAAATVPTATTIPTVAAVPAQIVAPVATAPPTATTAGADWPQWAGPAANYTSPETGLLREWPKEGPKVLWRAPIGQGWSCPSVAGNEVYVLSGVPSGKWEVSDMESIVCLDASTGKELWSYIYNIGVGSAHFYQKNVGWNWGGPRATPTVTEKYVYSIGLHGHMVCLDRKTHKPVWEQDLDKNFWPGPYPEWKGTNLSPLVADGVVLIPFANKVASCAALDGETGKVKWLYPADTQLPIEKGCEPMGGFFATFGSDRCIIIQGDSPNTKTSYRALRLSDGKSVWEFEWKAKDTSPYNGPVYVLDGQIVELTSPFVYLVPIDVDFKNPPFAAKTVGITRLGGGNPIHGLVPSGDYVYGFLETTGDTGKGLNTWSLRMTCVNRKTGEVAWKQEGFKMGYSVITADGLLFARSFQSLYLVEATPTGYVEKGKVEKLHDVTNKRGEDGAWVMPQLSHGKLYVRTPAELICFKVSKD